MTAQLPLLMISSDTYIIFRYFD